MSKQLNLKPAFTVSVIVSILAITASVGGLIIPDLYQDNEFVKSAWFTNDLITLIVAIPLLIASLLFACKGSLHWQLVWMGMLGYMIYNFAFYLFGAAFNVLFLVYVALFSSSIAALILGLSNLNVNDIALRFSPKTPVKVISIYIMLIAIMMFFVEMGMISSYFQTGILPETIKLTGHPTSIVFALDLSIVVPVSVVTAFLLWKRNTWGYILGMIMLLKGFTYGLVLSIGTALLAYSPAFGKWDPLMPFYILLVLGGFICIWAMIKNLKKDVAK